MNTSRSPARFGIYALLALVALTGVALVSWQSVQPRLDRVMRGSGPLTAAELADVGAVSLGDPAAPLVIVEFADFQCGACALYAERVLRQTKDELVATGRARLVFADFPLPSHQNAVVAARAGRCANEQDAFWTLHDDLYATQRDWMGASDARPHFVELASASGLDAGRFEECLRSRRHEKEVEESRRLGVALRVRGTPTIFINGQMAAGLPNFEELASYASRAEGAASPEGDAP